LARARIGGTKLGECGHANVSDCTLEPRQRKFAKTIEISIESVEIEKRSFGAIQSKRGLCLDPL
jgi:hypothetical protein